MKNEKIYLFLFSCLAYAFNAHAQINNSEPHVSIRISLLLLPVTPLVTIETRTLGPVTFQVETNFSTTHGVNVKCYTKKSMNGTYLFSGLAYVKDKLLREDNAYVRIPYVGLGYQYRFGKQNNYCTDGRFGIGYTINANESVLPIIKVGVGKIL